MGRRLGEGFHKSGGDFPAARMVDCEFEQKGGEELVEGAFLALDVGRADEVGYEKVVELLVQGDCGLG